MDNPKAKSQAGGTKSKQKSETTDDLPKFIYPLILPPSLRSPTADATPLVGTRRPRRRPTSEIVSELRRLRASPLRIDDETESWAIGHERSPPPARPVRTLEQLEQLRLSRHRLEQLLLRPAFEQAVSNCFVRVHINAEATAEMPEYRIAEVITAVELSEGYYVDSPVEAGGKGNRNGSLPTNMALRLRYDDVIKQHELTEISNMPFSRREFELWRDNCINQAIEPPTSETIARKKIELYNALNSEAKSIAMIQQAWTLPIRMPNRGDLLERHGAVYPWQLQRPPLPKPSPMAVGSTDTSIGEASLLASLSSKSSSMNMSQSESSQFQQPEEPEIEIEAINEELEAQRSLTRLRLASLNHRVRHLK
ncbi:uncharacterized protein Dwil_GK25522 [Drosophila willistoni]|uniref:Plus3 domain-containing protein n=1 Tax=Drosophila willistoni TaxID=7260 RepID=B4NDV9_DROWI|nr:uncharacterized protein LOC6649141 [Drosophila willistoni]EDW81928.1 uncharacterized protein Dwil_GK25522 [Drosophila willistoni]